MSFEPVKIKLSKPLTHGNEEITEIIIGREIVAGDLRGIPIREMTHDHMFEISSRVTGIPVPVIRKLSLKDYTELSEVMGSFFIDSH